MACPVLESMSTIGKKWTVPMIEELATREPEGFNEIFRKMSGITPTRLSERLKELVNFGFVTKTVLESGRSSYRLSEKGVEFHVLITRMKELSVKWGAVGDFCLNIACTDCEGFKGGLSYKK